MRTIQNIISTNSWALEPNYLAELSKQALPLVRGSREGSPPNAAPRFQAVGDTAVLQIRGLLMRSVPWWAEALGLDVSSYVDVGLALQAALDDPSVKVVKLVIDSPGGGVSGCHRLAEQIYVGRSQKPIVAQVEDLCASAAYWLASQCSAISANRTAQIGSIGVYRCVVDSSGSTEQAGLKVHVVASGPYKGLGTPGAPVQDEHLAEIRRNIDELAGIFLGSVVQGRGLSASSIEAVSTGATWLAQEARDLGLIDNVDGLPGPAGQSRLGALERLAAYASEISARDGVSIHVASALAAIEHSDLYALVRAENPSRQWQTGMAS